MILRYTNEDGLVTEVPLTSDYITIGRSPDADIMIKDERASRLHCGIRFEDKAFHLRDLQSKNGTYLNSQKIESEMLKPGDRFRVGSTSFTVEETGQTGPDTALHEVEEQMADGKGYRTILREIVDTVDPPNPS